MGQTSSKSGVREPLSNARGLYACDLQGNSLRKAMPSALQAGCFGRLPMDRGQTVKLPVRRRPQGWENHPPQSRFLPQSWLRWVRRSPLLRFARRLGLSRAATTFPRNIQLPVLALSTSRHKGSQALLLAPRGRMRNQRRRLLQSQPKPRLPKHPLQPLTGLIGPAPHGGAPFFMSADILFRPPFCCCALRQRLGDLEAGCQLSLRYWGCPDHSGLCCKTLSTLALAYSSAS